MRMRKLGRGQSLVFCVQDEIRAKILQFKASTDISAIEVSDVLCWTISETFLDQRRNMSLWAMQGRRFVNQQKVWKEADRGEHISMSAKMAEHFLEDESQSLEYRYRPRSTRGEHPYSHSTDGDESFARILERCREFDVSTSEVAALEEEQERELSPEIEEEREVEKPARAQALKHTVHKDLINLVTTGNITEHSQALLPAFQTLQNTTAAEYLDASQFPRDLLVTGDFSHTVRPMGKRYLADSYLRPIQWIITCTDINTATRMIIISPFEAQHLLSVIRKYKKVTLHNYLPRPSLQFRALDSLDLFTEGELFEPSTVPQHLRIQLNLFAGQLYVGTFKEYTAMCDFLGLAWQPQSDGVEVASDGFVVKGRPTWFTRSPVKFLHVLLTNIRRNCGTIDKTHMGRVLNGTMLEETEFVT